MSTDLPTPTANPPKPGALTFSAPKRGKAPRHLADLDTGERRAWMTQLGHKPYRADQISRHYFERLVVDPEQMTDLTLEDMHFAAPAPASVRGLAVVYLRASRHVTALYVAEVT